MVAGHRVRQGRVGGRCQGDAALKQHGVPSIAAHDHGGTEMTRAAIQSAERRQLPVLSEQSIQTATANPAMAATKANPEKVESMLDPTRGGLIQAVCWAGGQQAWVSRMLTTCGWLRSG